MPVLHLTSGQRERRLEFTAGSTLREVLHAHHAWLVSYCGGGGACGRCRVRVADPCEAPTSAERARLSSADLCDGVRLACQVRPVSDLRVTIDVAEAAPRWTAFDLGAAGHEVVAGRPPAWCLADAPLGAAVDLGTTHVRVSLWDVGRRAVVGRRWALNPQAAFGADVLSRLVAACESPGRATAMRDALAASIGDALGQLSRLAGRDPSHIGQVVLVGNTAMLALMAQGDCASLLDPDTWTNPVDWTPTASAGFGSAWGLAGSGAVRFARPVAGFVGSDLVAAVSATRLCEGPAGSLLIDFGTNSEVALWDGDTLWVTSAAGGPAFEGSGMLCGMPAAAGAIRRVTLERTDPLAFRCDVIGDGPGEGLTGPAIVDVIASLVDAGMVTPAGNLAGLAATGAIVQDRPRLVVTKRDIDAFQRAKAAIGAAVLLLLDRARPEALPLCRVCVCGVFGEHLQAAHAQRIGLLPQVPPDAIELRGQAALAGAEQWLFEDSADAAVADIVGRARVINLAHDPSYDGCFIENLRLRPMPPSGMPSC
jgi:uncharacterized 2Fe-2S/4Fe-4S cluster protein (DUF4445 family)